MKIILILTSVISIVFFHRVAADPKFVDDYHYPMVADELRNNKFFAALAKVIVPNISNVLDVGAGTMLLSMMGTKRCLYI